MTPVLTLIKLETPDYESFAEKCVEDLKALQNKFQEDYDLDWYESWFYNQVTGLLTFSTGDQQLNFRFYKVGGFSKKTNTWKWVWDNDSVLDKVKEKTKLVRELGEHSDFKKLTSGYFESDEIEAWEIAAIAVKITNGIGVYRPVSEEELQIYLIISEFVDDETARKIKDKYVECGSHEYRRRAFVCHHLKNLTRVGFEEAFETYEDMELLDDDDFQAWCSECETVRQEEGEWNDRSMAFAKIKVVCEKCYFEMKDLNLGHK